MKLDAVQLDLGVLEVIHKTSNMENIFDKEFQQKLKAFYSFDEGTGKGKDIGYRATGRSTILAKILLETAIESGREITLCDHYIDAKANRFANDDLYCKIKRYANNLEKTVGIHVRVERFRHSPNSFRAYVVGHHVVEENAVSTTCSYEEVRLSPFPIEKCIQRKEFLEKQLLLLLL